MSSRARGRTEMREEHKWGNPDLPADESFQGWLQPLDFHMHSHLGQPSDQERAKALGKESGKKEAEEIEETADSASVETPDIQHASEVHEDDVDSDEEEGDGEVVVHDGEGNEHGAVEAYTPSAGAVSASPQTAEYRDITDLLNLPQVEAARRLNLPMSTLSKRWKEAVRIRKWPYRQVAKLDKEIMTLLHNIPSRAEGDHTPTPPEIEQALGILLRRRQEELRPVRIRM